MKFLKLGLTVGAAMSLGFLSAEAQLLKRSDRPFIQSADGQLKGKLDGPSCAKTVSLIFTGPKRKFDDGTSARRMMNNVVRNLRLGCGSVSLIAAKGVTNERVVYNAVAEASSNWLLLELGGSASGGLLASGTVGQSGDLNKFSASKRFLSFGKLDEQMGNANYLCSQRTKDGCTIISELKNANEDRGTLISRYLLDSSGTLATVSYTGVNSGGFLCANPKSAKITVTGGKQSPAARQRLAQDLRERLEPYGTRICSGWHLSGGKIIGANFNDKGAQLGKSLVLTKSISLPKLRRSK